MKSQKNLISTNLPRKQGAMFPYRSLCLVLIDHFCHTVQSHIDDTQIFSLSSIIVQRACLFCCMLKFCSDI